MARSAASPAEGLAGDRRAAADACGEVPVVDLVAYNLDRLRATGYLDRFDGYLRQLGFDAEQRRSVRGASRSEILRLTRDVAAAAPWNDDPEAHLRAAGCRLALVVGDDARTTVDIEPLDPEPLLDRYAAMVADVRLLIGVDPHAAESLERALGLLEHPAAGGLAVSPFLAGVPVSDDAYAGVVSAAAERAVPLWVHCSAHFRPDVSQEVGHPRHVDRVLERHPGLRLMIGHAGWPWVADACVTALRHPSVALEFSTFPPRLLREPGWSLTPLLAHKDALRGRIFFGSGATSSPRRMEQLLDELEGLELGDHLDDWRGAALIDWLGAA